MLTDTPANRIKLTKWLKQIETDIRLDVFQYSSYFPDSKRASLFVKPDTVLKPWKNNLRFQGRALMYFPINLENRLTVAMCVTAFGNLRSNKWV